MPKLQNLDRLLHRALRVQEETCFTVCRDTTMCIVTFNEIMRLVLEYPLVFTQGRNTDQFVCVALFGVDPSENLYWRDGRWNAEFMPLNIARQPFSVDVTGGSAAGEGAPQIVTCIDVENPGVQDGAGERLFDDEGKETPYLLYKLGLLAELVEGELRSSEFVRRVAELELIRPIRLELTAPGLEQRKITGLHSIDEQKLRALDAATLAELNANGYLRAMHAMQCSLGHLQILARRSTRARSRPIPDDAMKKPPPLS
ncbi:MAG TPA: SapC family protein [Vicinamibacterales bacterium]|nr:SapC family protein [Vicinamibacterales bacterium]